MTNGEDLQFEVTHDAKDTPEVKLIKELISIVQGAPYPVDLSGELYTIWYEHAMKVITNAYTYIDEHKAE